MTISHLLETFEEAPPGQRLGGTLEDSRAEAELAAFENAYKAGWDDCHRAAQSSAAALSEDFAQNLRELGFTYQEAYSAVLRSLEPLVTELVAATLPEIACHGLGQHLLAEVQKIAHSHAGCTLSITCHPSKQSMLHAALPEGQNLHIALRTDAQFDPGQISLRFAGLEREIDIAGFTTQASQLIHSYFEDLKKEPVNG